MKSFAGFSLCPLVFVIHSVAFCENPVFEAIDYASPQKYKSISESLGDVQAITQQAQALKGDSDRKTLTNILNWMETELKYDETRAYEWRNYETVVTEKCYASCADQATTCGALLQGAGIPTVWVKTMDIDWIWAFKRNGPPQTWSGHVYLEVYLDGKWVLLNPGEFRIYDNYSTDARILPGNRFAYHKGVDPFEMVMSLQWDEWKAQTTTYFTNLDESLLPVDPNSHSDLRERCFVIGNSPYYQVLEHLARQQGLKLGRSFNTGYETFLPQAKGHTIIIETHDGIPIVSAKILQQYFPSIRDGKQSGKVRDGETTLIFIDFDDLGTQLNEGIGKEADTHESDSNPL